MGLLLDTTFLIDLERELSKKQTEKKTEYSVSDFLLKNSLETCEISVVTVGEFAEGFENSRYQDFRDYLKPFRILPIDQEVAWIYGQITRKLRKSGNLIGTNDLWISATAMRNNLKLVTRNIRHFSKIKHLELVTY